jgi:hypothetical protein
MPESLKVRELNGPADICNAPRDLSVDKITEPANAHNVCTSNGQFIGDRQEWFPPSPAKEPDAYSRAKENSMCRHSTDPNGCYLPEVVTVIRPLVEDDLDEPTTQQYT